MTILSNIKKAAINLDIELSQEQEEMAIKMCLEGHSANEAIKQTANPGHPETPPKK